jgi:hypothetical protein
VDRWIGGATSVTMFKRSSACSAWVAGWLFSKGAILVKDFQKR